MAECRPCELVPDSCPWEPQADRQEDSSRPRQGRSTRQGDFDVGRLLPGARYQRELSLSSIHQAYSILRTALKQGVK